MRRIALLLAALCIATPALARGRYNGVCAKSGAVQFGSIGPSTSTAALTFPLSTATIYQSDGVTLATIYSDNSGTPKSNPFTTGSDASLFFYADNGTYSVQCSGTGISAPFTFAGVTVLDPATAALAVSPPSFSVQIASNSSGLTSDANVLINTSTHALSAPVTNGVYNAASGFWGATPATDIGPNVNAAFAVAKNTGASVSIPAAACWPVNTTIQYPTGTVNLNLLGDVQGGSCLTAGGSLGANPVIRVGTPGVDVTTTGGRIAYLQISNGTPSSSGGVSGYDGIRIDDGVNMEIDHNIITSIKGNYGIVVKYGSNYNIHDNRVTNFAFAGIMALNNIDIIHIDNNIVDQLPLVSVSANAYGIAAGGYEGVHDGTSYPTNVWIRGNTVRNVVTWQGINSHGGEHEYISDNTVENVKSGIWVALQYSPGPASPVLDDIHIHDNHVKQGTGAANGEGITVQGDGSNNPFIPAGRAWIENNDVIGFGASSSAANSNLGSIMLAVVNDFHVNGNTCVQYNQYCIFLNFLSANGEITGNTGYDVVDSFSNQLTAVLGTFTGVYNVSVDKNCSEPTSLATYPLYLISNYTGTPTSHLKLGESNCTTGVSKATYRGTSAPFTAAPVAASGALTVSDGMKFLDTRNRVGWIASCSATSIPTAPAVTASLSGGAVNGITLTGGGSWPASTTVYLPSSSFVGGGGTGASAYFTTDGSGVPVSPGVVISGGSGFGSTPTVVVPTTKPGLCSLNTATISTGTMTLHSYTVSSLSGGAGGTTWYYWLPVNMNISIAGAGPGGIPLTAKIVANDQTSLTLDTAAVTAVSGANITLQAPNIASVSQLWIDPETVFTGNPCTGTQIISSRTWATTPSFGFRYSGCAFFAAYNAYQTTPGSSDSWTQADTASGSPGSSSYLFDISDSGIRMFVAAPSSAVNNFATFWGAARHTFSSTGYVTTGTVQGTKLLSTTNCSSSASPSVCTSASAGSVALAAAATTLVVNTTAVTANSQILVTRDDSLGTRLSVTCNTQSSLTLGTPRVTARTAATSFTITVDVAPTTNPMCIGYEVVN